MCAVATMLAVVVYLACVCNSTMLAGVYLTHMCSGNHDGSSSVFNTRM